MLPLCNENKHDKIKRKNNDTCNKILRDKTLLNTQK